MTTNATNERPRTLVGQLAVPWSTVLPLALVMAYADGFWLVSLRGAVGAIERTQGPFTTWLRESTLALPLFVFAVLGALTLASRRFGPTLRTWKSLTATALLIVAAGSLAGIAVMAASSAYDYHLQSSQLQLMASMSDTCAGATCLAQQLQATLALQVHAVSYGSAILLATNTVLVGWVLALRGGQLKTFTTGKQAHHNRVGDLALYLAAGLVGSAAIHGAVVPQHLVEWGAAGVFFIALAAAEIVLAAALLLNRLQPTLLLAAVVVSAGPLALWLYSRTIGIPFGPGAGLPEQIGLADLAACTLEATTLLIALNLLRHSQPLRPPTPAHTRWLALLAITAATTIGLAGTGLTWLNDFPNPNNQPGMSTTYPTTPNQPALHPTTTPQNNTTTATQINKT